MKTEILVDKNLERWGCFHSKVKFEEQEPLYQNNSKLKNFFNLPFRHAHLRHEPAVRKATRGPSRCPSPASFPASSS